MTPSSKALSRRTPFYPRLLLLIGGTTFVISLLMALIAARIFGAMALDIAARNQLAHLEHNAAALWVVAHDDSALTAQVDSIWGHLESMDWVMGRHGQVFSTSSAHALAEGLLQRAEAQLGVEGQGNLSQNASATHTGQRWVLVTRRSPSGWVFALQYRPLTAPRQRQSMALILAGVLATAVASSLFSSWLFSRPLHRRLEVLHQALQRYGGGDKGQRLELPSRPHELSSLYRAFNTMADRITSLESAEASRRQRQRTLLAGLAHDINTPMTVIRGASEVLLDRTVLNAQQRNVVSTVVAQTLDVQALVDDLLALTGSEDESLRLSQSEVDLDSLIDALVDTFALTASQRRIALFGDGHGLSVQADALRLRQMLTNLIRNSLEHGDGVSTVEISARETAHGVEILVQDDGAGVPPGQQPHLFAPYRRGSLEGEGNTNYPDMDSDSHWGLGLAIVRLLAELHGGDVRYRDAEPGACFVVTLPGSAPLRSHNQVSPNQPAETST